MDKAETREERFVATEMKDKLLERGWVEKSGVIVRFSNPRIGWKPSDGTLIIGYHEYPRKVKSIEQLKSIIDAKH